MTDLRKAAEALLNHWEAGEYKNCTGYMAGHIRVLREALDDKPAVKSYCGGKPNYTTPVDAVDTSQEHVDETAKGEQEPQKRSFSEDVGRLLSTGKGFYADGTPIDPKEINIKIEGVGDGVVTCTEVHLPSPPQKEWVGLKGDEISECWKTGDVVAAVEAKLKEKNT